MEQHIIYIITDSNRTYLEIGYCNDLNVKLQEIRDSSSILFSNNIKLNSIVYTECFDSYEKAASRKTQLRQFTRMQREKLIRLKNPNWLNLYPVYPRIAHKKAVVYA